MKDRKPAAGDDTDNPDKHGADKRAATGLLAGTRIVEFAGLGPGPFACMILADLGAEVVRVARDAPTQEEARIVLNRNRRHSAVIDLKSPAGRDEALRLIAGADAVVEGFRPGVMERLGLGPETCLGVNPALVYCRCTGWGQDGPLAKTAGHDINYIALSGALHAIGPRHGKPVAPPGLVGDFGGGGMIAAIGVLAALNAAAHSGEGRVIDAAMVDGAAMLMALFYGMKAEGSWRDERGVNLVDGGRPYYDTYACADGRHVAVGPIENRFYAEFLSLLGLGDIPAQAQDDPALWPETSRRIAERLATKSRDEWCRAFEGSDACLAPVLSMAEAPAHDHNVARGTFLNEWVLQPAPAPRFSGIEAAVRPLPATLTDVSRLAAE